MFTRLCQLVESPLLVSDKHVMKPTLARMPSYSESSFSSFPAFHRSLLQVSNELPSLHCILYYDIQTMLFTVRIVSGHNLKSDDEAQSNASRHSYVSLYLLPHKEEIYRTKTIECATGWDHTTLFNETFNFKDISYSEISLRTLVLSVYSEHRFVRNHLIGTAKLSLNKTELYGVEVSVILNSTLDIDNSTEVKGDVQVSMRYNQSSNVLNGTIIKATNLKRMDLLTLTDPYVVLKVHNCKGEVVDKWQSKVIRNTLTPEYNQDFMFDLEDMNINEIVLELVIKDKDIFTRDDYIGQVCFGKSVKHDSGKNHWREIVDNPFTRIARWHTLQ